MARKDVAIRDSRYTMAVVHGPGEPDSSRQQGRALHGNGTNVCGGMYDWPWFGMPSYWAAAGITEGTRYLRLRRSGNAFIAYGSMAKGLGDGTLDPRNDGNWVPGAWDDWGADAVETVYVGFANSEHGDGGAGVQTYQYRILPCDGTYQAPLAHPTRWYGGDGGGGIAFNGGDVLWQLRNDEKLVSFAVEFDNWSDWAMWNSGGGTNEPMPFGGSWRFDGSYHIGLDINGNTSSVQQSAQMGHTYDLPEIYNGPGVHTKVQYRPEGWVDVWVSPAGDDTAEPIHVISKNVPTLTGPIVIGLNGATGGATTTEDFDNLVVTATCCEGEADTVAIGGPATALPNSSVDLTAVFTGADAGSTVAYAWSTDKGTLTGEGAAVTLSGVPAGETATVTLVANDGECAGASSTKAIAFISCPAVTAEIGGAPAELPTAPASS
jgi:hypothetical protein